MLKKDGLANLSVSPPFFIHNFRAESTVRTFELIHSRLCTVNPVFLLFQEV